MNTPAGLVISLGGKIVYLHLGDTCLFSDLRLVPERNPVDAALVCIGGHSTRDRHDAAVAAELLGAGTVIPCHYDTFPPIETDAQVFQVRRGVWISSKVEILAPGELVLGLAALEVQLDAVEEARDRTRSGHTRGFGLLNPLPHGGDPTVRACRRCG